MQATAVAVVGTVVVEVAATLVAEEVVISVGAGEVVITVAEAATWAAHLEAGVLPAPIWVGCPAGCIAGMAGSAIAEPWAALASVEWHPAQHFEATWAPRDPFAEAMSG